MLGEDLEDGDVVLCDLVQAAGEDGDGVLDDDLVEAEGEPFGVTGDDAGKGTGSGCLKIEQTKC